MKKILSLVLVLSLVLGSMSMAFAAAPSFSDVENEDVLKAVLRLNAFGIVDGYNDGSYKPENNITRAEFSKLLVTALGLENAAKAASGISHFSDVTGNEWFAGAVNVAAGQGIVKGYADGTYRPDAEVKYSEAVTMLVRALGYKDEFLPGKWPGNFIAKAADAGITDDVTFQPNGIANRGSVAMMLNNALDAKMVKVNAYNKDIFNASNDGIMYGLSDDTLLSDKLGIDKYESIELTETPKVDSGLDADQVAFRETDDSKMNGEDHDEFKLPNKFDVKDADMLNVLETRLGEALNVYVDDDEVVFFETTENAYTVKWGTILAGGDVDTKAKEITVTFVDGDDKTYDYDEDDIKLYIDNDDKKLDDLEAGLFGKFVIADNGDIALADLHNWDDQALIVTESKADEFDYVAATDSHKTFEADDFDKVVVMDTTGKVMSMEDLAKDTVVYINEATLAESGDDVAYVVAVETAAVTETSESYDIDADEYEFETKEGGTYDVNTKYGTVSTDKDDDFVEFKKAEDELETVTDGNEKVAILFDIVKNIRHIRTDVDVSSSDMFGVVIGAAEDKFDRTEVQLKILTSAGDKVVYDLDHSSGKDKDFYNMDSVLRNDSNVLVPYTGEGDLVNMVIGTIVKYTLDSDGDIDSLIAINKPVKDNDNEKLTELDANDNADDYTIEDGILDEDIEKDSIEFVGNGGKYTVDSNVVVFDVSGTDADDMDTVKFENLIGIGKSDRLLVVANDDEEVILLVSQDVGADDQYVGYLLDTRERNSDHFFKMDVFGEGEKEYEVNNTKAFDEDAIAEQSMVVFVKNSDGTIDVVAASDETSGLPQPKDPIGILPADADFNLSIGQVLRVDGNWLEIDTNGDRNSEGKRDYEDKVKLYDDTLIYEKDKDNKDIDEFDFVLVAKDGTKARVVKRYKINYKEFDRTASQEKMFIKDIKHINNVSDLSGFYYGDGEKPSGPVNAEGVITYINSAKTAFEVDGKIYTITGSTVLKNADGTTAALGLEVGSKIVVNDQVKVDGNVITFVAKAADRLAAAAIDTQIAGLSIANQSAPSSAERTAITNARNAYKALTTVQQALVTKLADLEALEAIIAAVDAPANAAAAAVKAVTDAVGENDKAKFITALDNSLFKNVIAANNDAYWAAKATFVTDVDTINAAITTVNNNQAAAAVEKAKVDAAAAVKTAATGTKTAFLTALADDHFKASYKAANDDAYWAAKADFAGITAAGADGDTDVAEVVAELVKVNDAEAVKADAEAVKTATYAAQSVAWDTNETITETAIRTAIAALVNAKTTVANNVTEASGVTWNEQAATTPTAAGLAAADYTFDITVTDGTTTETVTITVNVTVTP